MCGMTRRRRSERGVFAIIFALMATVIFGIAALGVDLGNAMNRKKELQTNADLAALAGGGFLPAPSTTPTSGDDIVQAVAKYLYDNVVSDDSGFRPAPAIIASKIVSANSADRARYGRVQYGYYHPNGTFIPNANFVTVTAPTTRVNFGLATAMGKSGANVAARATVALKSKGSSSATLPFYAYDGCDWGQQIISHSTENAAPPTLYAPTDNNQVSLTQPTAMLPNANPTQVTHNDTTTVLTLAGLGLTASVAPNNQTVPGIIALGLFLPDGSQPAEISASNFEPLGSDTQIRFRLPATVAANDGAVYYLRVATWVNEGNKNSPNYQKRWSAVSLNMPHVEVGSATLFCNDAKSAGNFGSLSVFRLDSGDAESTGWLPLNIATGLHDPYAKLNTYRETISDSSCNNGDSYAKPSDEEQSGVLINCAVTNVGFPQNAATNGFLTGVGGTPGAPGRLTKPASLSSGCGGSNGAPALRDFRGHQINNEVLSCFFTNSSVKVSDVSSENYSGDVVLDPSIWGSPRFFSLPIIKPQPDNGKKAFPIIDFRYAFLTGENGTAFKNHGNAPQYYWDDSDTNGLSLEGNSWNSVKISSFRVVFIHPKAVPPPPGGGRPQEFDGVEGQLYLVD
jgi:hypothetical protein